MDIHIQDIRSAGWHLDAACLAALAALILPLACLPSLALSVVVVDVTVVVVVDDCAFSRPDFPPRLPADYPAEEIDQIYQEDQHHGRCAQQHGVSQQNLGYIGKIVGISGFFSHKQMFSVYDGKSFCICRL